MNTKPNKQSRKEENSPFAGLQGLFDGDEMVLSKKRARHVIEEIIAPFQMLSLVLILQSF